MVIYFDVWNVILDFLKTCEIINLSIVDKGAYNEGKNIVKRRCHDTGNPYIQKIIGRNLGSIVFFEEEKNTFNRRRTTDKKWFLLSMIQNNNKYPNLYRLLNAVANLYGTMERQYINANELMEPYILKRKLI